MDRSIRLVGYRNPRAVIDMALDRLNNQHSVYSYIASLSVAGDSALVGARAGDYHAFLLPVRESSGAHIDEAIISVVDKSSSSFFSTAEKNFPENESWSAFHYEINIPEGSDCRVSCAAIDAALLKLFLFKK